MSLTPTPAQLARHRHALALETALYLETRLALAEAETASQEVTKEAAREAAKDAAKVAARAARTKARIAARADRIAAFTADAEDPRHGTVTGYGYGCRLACCKAANRDNSRRQRREHPGRWKPSPAKATRDARTRKAKRKAARDALPYVA